MCCILPLRPTKLVGNSAQFSRINIFTEPAAIQVHNSKKKTQQHRDKTVHRHNEDKDKANTTLDNTM